MKSDKQNTFTYAVVIWIFAVVMAFAICLYEQDLQEPQAPQTSVSIENKTAEIASIGARVALAIHHEMVKMSDDERGLLALVVYHEARGEPFDGQVAVVEVILNRVQSQRFPNTINDVVYQKDPLQFACSPVLKTACIAEPKCLSVAFDAIDAALKDSVLKNPYLFFSTGKPHSNNFQKIGNHYFY